MARWSGSVPFAVSVGFRGRAFDSVALSFLFEWALLHQLGAGHSRPQPHGSSAVASLALVEPDGPGAVVGNIASQ
jgi:hypothetical protein